MFHAQMGYEGVVYPCYVSRVEDTLEMQTLPHGAEDTGYIAHLLPHQQGYQELVKKVFDGNQQKGIWDSQSWYFQVWSAAEHITLGDPIRWFEITMSEDLSAMFVQVERLAYVYREGAAGWQEHVVHMRGDEIPARDVNGLEGVGVLTVRRLRWLDGEALPREYTLETVSGGTVVVLQDAQLKLHLI